MSRIIYSGKWYGVPCTIDDENEMILGKDGKEYILCKDEYEDGCYGFNPHINLGIVSEYDNHPLVVEKLLTKGKIIVKGSAKNLFKGEILLDGFTSKDSFIRLPFYSAVEMDMSSLDTSQVTDMTGMFARCRYLKKIDVSSFDTSNVESMYAMFFKCIKVKELDLTSFDTNKVKDMSYMFFWCSELEKLDLTSFAFYRCPRIDNMFNHSNNKAKIYIDYRYFESLYIPVFDDMFSEICNTYSFRSN